MSTQSCLNATHDRLWDNRNTTYRLLTLLFHVPVDDPDDKDKDEPVGHEHDNDVVWIEAGLNADRLVSLRFLSYL